MRALIPPVLFFACLGAMALLRLYWPIAIFAPYPYNLIGLAPIGAGSFIGFSGMHKFMRVGTNLHTFHEPDSLVTDGPFRYTRNPMYLGFVLMLSGAWILLGAASAVLGVLVFALLADRWYIAYEERMMSRKFGADFAAYCARTRRWV